MAVSRRNLLRSAAAVVPALAVGGALPGAASAAGAAQAQWQLFPVSGGSGGGYAFNRLGLAPNGSATALATYITFDGNSTEEEPAAFGFDGRTWESYRHSRFPDGTRPLNGLSVETGGAWGVGSRWNKQTMRDDAQILYWDGSTWADRTAGAAIGEPHDVDGTGADVWVVGGAKHPATGAVALRRGGSGWTSVPLPSGLGAGARLLTVRVVAADDVWAGGFTAAEAFGTRTPLVLHWNGSSWKKLPNPFGTANGQVSSLLSHGGALWAGGFTGPGIGGGVGDRAAVAAWNGGAWSSRTPAGLEASEATQLAAYGSEVWVAGRRTPLQRWTGGSWSPAAGPKPEPLTVGALATAADGSLWLGGNTEGGSAYFFARLPAAS
ncbi:hypothetical protein [Streptomyces sp. NPDC127108]|uniref:hypothetical protein n=1 Tax=Streptomyces sp. NPDC127108 TaxID=3345361 RepID=UPI00362A803E